MKTMKTYSGWSIIIAVFIIMTSCDAHYNRMTNEQRAATIFIDSLLNQGDSLISVEIGDFFSCRDEFYYALVRDPSYNRMMQEESQIDSEIRNEYRKMREYEYNSNRHSWNIEHLTDKRNQLKEDMSEYEKYYTPPVVNDVAYVRYRTQKSPRWNYICLVYNYSHNSVIREIHNEQTGLFEIIVEDNNKGLMVHGFHDTIIAPIYDDVSIISKQGVTCFIASNNSKKAVYNDTLGLIIPLEYDSIIVDSHVKSFYFASKDDKWGVFDYCGKQIVPIEYDGILYSYSTFDENWNYTGYDDILFFVKKGGISKGIWKGPQNNDILENGLWGLYKGTKGQIHPCEYSMRDLPPSK